MAQVFISFVHEDEQVASAVQSLIKQELKLGDDVFLSSDQSQMFAGDLWLDKIRQSLAGARVVVLLLSRRSINRPWVNFESGAAWLTNKTIVPCCFGLMNKEHLPHPYSSIHALDLRAQAFYLLESVHRHLKLETPKPRSPVMKGLFEALAPGKEEQTGPGSLIAKLVDPYNILYHALDRFEHVA